jgi:hypothetical protein
MEGNYRFEWTAVSAAGVSEGVYEQTIYGESLTKAVEQFESFHGSIGPDEDGMCIIITCISWQPL